MSPSDRLESIACRASKLSDRQNREALHRFVGKMQGLEGRIDGLSLVEIADRLDEVVTDVEKEVAHV